MGQADAATAGCCNLITYIMLLIFTAVALGTYGWGVALYEIENEAADCSSDVDWFIGLQQQYRSYDNGCTGEDSSDTTDFNCDNLSDKQCDYLNEARDSSAVAVTCCVILVILFGIVMVGVRKPGGKIMYVLVLAALVVGVIMLSTAFAATTAYMNLIDELNDLSGEFDMSPGFSLNLMMSAGVIGIPALGCSVATIYFYAKQESPPDGLTETLTESKASPTGNRSDQM